MSKAFTESDLVDLNEVDDLCETEKNSSSTIQTTRNEVFKRNLLRRLYGEPDSPDPVREDCEVTNSDQTKKLNSSPKKKLYTVLGPPTDFVSESPIPQQEETECVKEGTESSSDACTAENEEVRKRRRRNRKRKHGSTDVSDSMSNVPGKSSSEAPNLTLTKNQKRKLKKKRRKERDMSSNDGKSQEFTYKCTEDADTMESDKQLSKQDNCQKALMLENVPKLMEFFKAVWEVYEQDEMAKTSGCHQSERMDKLMSQLDVVSDTAEETELNTLKTLWHLKSLLVLGDRTRAEEILQQLETSSQCPIFDSDSRDLVCTLMRYWLNSVMRQR